MLESAEITLTYQLPWKSVLQAILPQMVHTKTKWHISKLHQHRQHLTSKLQCNHHHQWVAECCKIPWPSRFKLRVTTCLQPLMMKSRNSRTKNQRKASNRKKEKEYRTIIKNMKMESIKVLINLFELAKK